MDVSIICNPVRAGSMVDYWYTLVQFMTCEQPVVASNLSPPRQRIHIVSSRPSSTSMALPGTKRVGRGLIICPGGRPIVTCIVLLCALFFYDNDTTYTTRCDVDLYHTYVLILCYVHMIGTHEKSEQSLLYIILPNNQDCGDCSN